MKYIDLTHTLKSDIPTWDDSCGFHLKLDCDYKDCEAPYFFRTQSITTNLSLGTHMDAPAHCIEGSDTIEKLDLEKLITDCFIIKVDDVADENYKITPDVVEKFEQENGKITENSFVIFYTGWDKYWDDPEKYRNNLQFPSVHEDTAKLLIERKIIGIGTDTLSADSGGKEFSVHNVILGANKYLVENIANAKDLPSFGFKVMIIPLKIEGATESPVRLVAVL